MRDFEDKALLQKDYFPILETILIKNKNISKNREMNLTNS